MIRLVFLLLVLFLGTVMAQDVIDITVKGISDSKNDGAQIDRQEAIMDAKRQACEKAGVKLQSNTTVENFQVKFDYIESKAKAVLLPGFQIIDVGYMQDGTYQVVLTGKIKTIKEDEPISAKELRLAKVLHDKGSHSESSAILKKYIENTDKDVPEALQEESLYLYIKWGYSYDTENDCEKYAAYYPDNSKTKIIEAFGAFAKKPLLKYDKTVDVDNDNWQDAEIKGKTGIFTKQKTAISEKHIIKDFMGNDQEVDVQLLLLHKEDMDDTNPAAYLIKMSYINDGEPKVFEERIKEFRKAGSKTFQHSTSGYRFKNFSMRYFMIKGDAPLDQDHYSINLQYEIYQKSF